MNWIEVSERIFPLNVDDAIAILFWGNLLFSGVFTACLLYIPSCIRRRDLIRCAVMRFIQSTGWLLILLDAGYPATALGICSLVTGYFLEGWELILYSVPENRLLRRIQVGILIISLLCGVLLPYPFLTAPALLILPAICLTFKNATGGVSRIISALLLPLLPVPYIVGLVSGPWNCKAPGLPMTAIALLLLTWTLPFILWQEKALVNTEKTAMLDGLTGLSNRQGFLLAVSSSFEWHKRAQLPVSLLFMDIDLFKQVNDQYGHAFGDAVIEDFADCIKRSSRKSDFCCRYGGEEFLVFLSGSAQEQAEHICERIHKEAASSRFVDNPEFTYTVSIGIMSGIPTKEQVLGNFIEASDKAMYQSKNNGRNRTTVWKAECFASDEKDI